MDHIYIMHDETFLPELMTMQVYRGIGSLDHFSIVLECTNQIVDYFRSLLENKDCGWISLFLDIITLTCYGTIGGGV